MASLCFQDNSPLSAWVLVESARQFLIVLPIHFSGSMVCKTILVNCLAEGMSMTARQSLCLVLPSQVVGVQDNPGLSCRFWQLSYWQCNCLPFPLIVFLTWLKLGRQSVIVFPCPFLSCPSLDCLTLLVIVFASL